MCKACKMTGKCISLFKVTLLLRILFTEFQTQFNSRITVVCQFSDIQFTSVRIYDLLHGQLTK